MWSKTCNSMLTQHGSSVQWQCTGLNQWILSASSPVSTDKSSWSVTSHPAWTCLHRNSKQENKSPEINSYVVQHSNPSVVHIASVLVLLVLAIFFPVLSTHCNTFEHWHWLPVFLLNVATSIYKYQYDYVILTKVMCTNEIMSELCIHMHSRTDQFYHHCYHYYRWTAL